MSTSPHHLEYRPQDFDQPPKSTWRLMAVVLSIIGIITSLGPALLSINDTVAFFRFVRMVSAGTGTVQTLINGDVIREGGRLFLPVVYQLSMIVGATLILLRRRFGNLFIMIWIAGTIYQAATSAYAAYAEYTVYRAFEPAFHKPDLMPNLELDRWLYLWLPALLYIVFTSIVLLAPRRLFGTSNREV